MTRVWLIAAAAALLAVAAGCDPSGAGAGLGGSSGQTEKGEFTILLKTFLDEDHISEATHYKDQTEKLASWQGLFVVHTGGKSELYWGKYATAGAAERNLREARTWVTPAGLRLYAGAVTMRLPGLDLGPPEWNLRNAQGVFTLCVAEFYNMESSVPGVAYTARREDAVEACRGLRLEGEDAYYFHNASRSYVTLGAFDGKAVQTVERQGRWVQEIMDPRLKAMMDKHPKLAVNGREQINYIKIKNSTEKKAIISGSYTMEIPNGEGRTGTIRGTGQSKRREGPRTDPGTGTAAGDSAEPGRVP